MKKRFRTIGVMMDWLRSPYHAAIAAGIQEQADRYGLNTLYFRVGELLPGLLEHNEPDHLYKLINKNFLDCLLVLPGVMHRLTAPRKAQLLKGLSCPVIITLCFEAAGFPAILLDNRTGFSALVTHILETHNRRKPAFLAGPRNNQDAGERLAVFREVMALHNLPVLPGLVVEDGAFTVFAGENAVSILTGERQLVPGRDFDTVIAANDAMAIGAANRLTALKVRIPQDVSIGGFDAIDTGVSLDTPLTTVRMPYRELGSRAVSFFMNRESTAAKIVIPTILVIRQSCGCSREIKSSPVFASHTDSVSPAAVFRGDRAVIEQRIYAVFDQQLTDKTPVQLLLEQFALLLENPGTNSFLAGFRQLLTSAGSHPDTLMLWNYPLNILKHWLLNVLPGNSLTPAIKAVLDQGHCIINARINLDAIDYKTNLENYILYLRYTDEMIRINLEQKELLLNLTSEMTRIFFTSYHIFLYEYPGQDQVGYRLLFSCLDNEPVPGEPLYWDFSSIVEHCLARDKPFAYFILPVSYYDQKYGFILIAMSDKGYARIAYEDVAYQLGSNFRSNAILMTTQETNRKLQTANTVLVRAQQQLKQEMEVARKIQESLLPGKLEHRELEMAARMVTAVYVGGDYYDFIPTGTGPDWIVLGDASGHGMNAGLLMMMVQTAIHILLKQEPGIAPHVLLARVNDVLFNNIRKLGETKYVTLVALSYSGQGKFTFSGMHLPLLVYRQRTGCVEIITTGDIWLGIMENIEGVNRDYTFVLEKGDCLLLYTDGVTEAVDRANNSRMYGDDRLHAVFKRTGHNPPASIIADLFADLTSYSIEDDDVTLFVIRYK